MAVREQIGEVYHVRIAEELRLGYRHASLTEIAHL
jgi:hypothetical protein